MLVDNIYFYSCFQEDFYLDVIDLMLLIVELESCFNVYFFVEEYDVIEIVEDVMNYLMKYVVQWQRKKFIIYFCLFVRFQFKQVGLLICLVKGSFVSQVV